MGNDGGGDQELADLIRKHLVVSARKVGDGLEDVSKASPVDLPPGRYHLVSSGVALQGGITRENKKDGGEVDFRPDGVVVNKLDPESARLWAALSEGLPNPSAMLSGVETEQIVIPVAPVLLRRDGRPRLFEGKDKSTVISRFCGLNLRHLFREIEDVEGEIVAPGLNDLSLLEAGIERQATINILTQTVLGQVETIKSDLRRLGVTHEHGVFNHTRVDNFTVEFIRKSAMANYAGSAINHRYQPDEISHNPRVYIEHPDEYQVVVRIIDMDHLGYDGASLSRIVRGVPHLTDDHVAGLLEGSDYQAALGETALWNRWADHRNDLTPVNGRLNLTLARRLADLAFPCLNGVFDSYIFLADSLSLFDGELWKKVISGLKTKGQNRAKSMYLLASVKQPWPEYRRIELLEAVQSGLVPETLVPKIVAIQALSSDFRSLLGSRWERMSGEEQGWEIIGREIYNNYYQDYSGIRDLDILTWLAGWVDRLSNNQLGSDGSLRDRVALVATNVRSRLSILNRIG